MYLRKQASVVFLLLFASLAFAGRAFAQPKEPSSLDEAKALFKTAEVDYRVGRYEEALEGYKQAYLLSRASGLLYNMAQCQRNLGRYEEALRSYRLYLQDTPESPYRAQVEKVIVELEALIPKPTPTSSPSLELKASEAHQILTSQPAPLASKEEIRDPPSLVLPGALAGAGALLGGAFWLLHRSAFVDEDFSGEEKKKLIVLGAAADLTLLASGSWLLITYKKRKASTAMAPDAELSMKVRQ